jgi:hypothetical protein
MVYVVIADIVGVILFFYSMLLIADMVDKRRGRKP